MTNTNQDMNKMESHNKGPMQGKGSVQEKGVMVDKKIKETWSQLNDEDISLYASDRKQFLSKLQEKQDVSKEDGEKKLREIEETCTAECSRNKTDSDKAA